MAGRPRLPVLPPPSFFALRAANDGAAETPPSRRTADPHVARALAAMTGDPSRRWTVAALARAAGLSRAAFARRFTGALGVAPLRWLAEHRRRLAEERLLETDLPLAAIAAEVGYRCEFAFAKAYKRLAGIPPGVFRRLVRAHRGALAPLCSAA
jgi:transcriptional regulator GlxA family with amidase domain